MLVPVYKCKICGVGYYTLKDIIEHLREHPKFKEMVKYFYDEDIIST